MSEQTPLAGAIFISYCSQDAAAAERIGEALRAAGVEVWLDKNELRGGDAWDAQIKKRIHDCALFIPLISAHSNARSEGYFRREWKLAIRRLLDISDDVAFLVPVVVDETREAEARVPEEFQSAQWTRLPGGETSPAFAQRVRHLLGGDAPSALPTTSASSANLESRARIGHDRKRGTPPLRFLMPALIALLTLGAGAFWYFQRASDPASASPAAPVNGEAVAVPHKLSIAVLPFADMSVEKNQEYMSDGIAEELLNLLARVPDLKVIARTSSFAFKGQQIEVADIAKKLNVAHVLEGSVRTSGDKLRITAQLIRTADSTHVWSNTYDRPINDVFAVQDEIANAIVQALQIRLMGGALSGRDGGTENLEAYRLYLRGLSAENLNTEASLKTAADDLEKAIELDANYARAFSTLALIVTTQTDSGFILPAKTGYERARQLATHALKLSPELAEAHAVLAYLHQCLWNWEASRIEVQRALAIDPANPWAVETAGLLASSLGQWDEAVRQLRAGAELDPLDTYSVYNLGVTYYLAGRFAEAEATFEKLLKMQPGFTWTRRMLGKTLLAQGKAEAALATVQQEKDDANRVVMLPVVLRAVGREAEADEALKKLISDWGDTWPFYVAQAYAHGGDRDRALDWLERAYQQNDISLSGIVGEPLFRNLFNDPRFKAFLRKLNLPVPEDAA